MGKNKSCGGYSSVDWESPSSPNQKSDNKAFLFSLDLKEYFPVKDQTIAIGCWEYSGPCFGDYELSAYHEPFINDNNCWSYSDEKCYKIPADSTGCNLLTGSKDRNFLISELEVFSITYVY